MFTLKYKFSHLESFMTLIDTDVNYLKAFVKDKNVPLWKILHYGVEIDDWSRHQPHIELDVIC